MTCLGFGFNNFSNLSSMFRGQKLRLVSFMKDSLASSILVVNTWYTFLVFTRMAANIKLGLTPLRISRAVQLLLLSLVLRKMKPDTWY